MRLEGGRPAARAARSSGLAAALSPSLPLRRLGVGIPTGTGSMLYSSMKHRTQLYLDEGQYRWLKQRAGSAGSIAAVVRDLIEAERSRSADPAGDPLLRFLAEEAPARGPRKTSVSTLDRDVYGP